VVVAVVWDEATVFVVEVESKVVVVFTVPFVIDVESVVELTKKLDVEDEAMDIVDEVEDPPTVVEIEGTEVTDTCEGWTVGFTIDEVDLVEE
jgi:hypothetical protein